MAKLDDFEGTPVAKTSIAITNAGDGLSASMKIKPEMMRLGQKKYVLMECEVVKVRHEELKDQDALERVHVLKAGTATIVTKKFAEDSIKAAAAAIERAQDEAAGVERIPGTAPYADDPGEGAEAGDEQGDGGGD